MPDVQVRHYAWLAVALVFATCRLIAYLPPEINSFAASHYLFSYAAGFHKRALIGSLLSLYFDRLSGNDIYAISLAVLGVFAGALVLLLRRALLKSSVMLVLGVVLLGAPGALPHLAYSIGYFDPMLLLWAFLALSLLASPLPDWLKVPVTLVPCALGVFTHESFLLAAFPVTVGWSLITQPQRRGRIWILALAVLLLTVIVQVFGQPGTTLTQYMEQATARTDIRMDTEAFQLLYFRPQENLLYLLQHYSSVTTGIRLLAGLIVPIPYFVLLRDLYSRAAAEAAMQADVRPAVLACIFAPIVLALVGFDVLRWVSLACLNCSIFVCAYVRSDSSGTVAQALGQYVRSPRFMLLALLSYSMGALHVVDSNSLGSGVHAMLRGLGLLEW